MLFHEHEISERTQKTNTRGISVMTYRYKHNKVEKHYVRNKNSWNKVGKIEGTASETRVVKPRETVGEASRDRGCSVKSHEMIGMRAV